MGLKESVQKFLHIEHTQSYDLVVSIFDVKAGQHMPLNLCKNLNIAWRLCNNILANSPVAREEFLLCIHGEMNTSKSTKAFQPYMEEVWYDMNQNIMSAAAIEKAVELAKLEGTIGAKK